MYIVMMIHNFDPETKAVLFSDYLKAKAYLHWQWEEYYNVELAEGVIALNEELCYHEDEYGLVSWVDGDQTEFVLTEISEADDKFESIDWERYL